MVKIKTTFSNPLLDLYIVKDPPTEEDKPPPLDCINTSAVSKIDKNICIILNMYI